MELVGGGAEGQAGELGGLLCGGFPEALGGVQARADGSAYVIDTLKPHTLFRYLSKERDGSYILSAENDKRGPIYLAAADILNIYDIVGSFRIGR